MKSINISRVVGGLLSVIVCAGWANAKELLNVSVSQDGYRFSLMEGKWGDTTKMTVELNHIDDSVIDAAIKSGGELKLPDEVVYEGTHYPVTKLACVLNNVDGLKSVVFPQHTEAMYYCLNNCNDLSSIIFNEGLSGCALSLENLPSLTALDLPESFSGLGELSLNGLSVNEIDVSRIQYVQKCSCSGWLNVKRLVLASLNNAEMYTFGNMPKLEEIVLPEVVECLSPNMFSECPNVRRIYAKSTTPPALGEWGKPGNILALSYGIGFFGDEPTGIDKSTCVLYVPEGSETLYREHEYWGRFKNIVAHDYAGVYKVAVEGNAIDRLRVEAGKILVPECGGTVTVSDMNGRTVYRSEKAVAAEVAVAPGIYIVSIGADTGKLVVR